MATFQQVPMQHIINRLEKSHHVCEDLLKSLSAYADLHDRVANSTHKIARPNIYENEIFHSTTERALGFLKNYFLFTAREYANYTRNVNSTACKSLESFLGEQASKNMEFKVMVQHAMKDVASATEKHARVRRNYSRIQQEVRTLQEKLAHQMEAAEHNDVERLQSKLMRLQDDQRGQDAELSSTRRELLLKMQGRDEALAASSEHFQLSELTRLQLIKKQLNSFIQHERKLLQSRMSLLSTFEEAVDAINPSHDVGLFTERNKNPDQVHKVSRALSLLDWDSQRRKEAKGQPSPSVAAQASTQPVDEENHDRTGEMDQEGVRTHVENGLTTIFSNPSHAMAESVEWRQLLVTDVGRQHLIKVLNERRTGSSLSTDAFRELGKVLVDLLDICVTERDVKSAMQASNMGNTFFEGTEEDVGTREYLHKVFKDHQIWRTRHFWEDALMQGVAEQFDVFPSVQWDELSPEELKEAVLRVHNTVYGQLGSIAFNMKDVGMSKEEIEEFMLNMSRRSQLTEDQEQELLRNMRSMFGTVEQSISTSQIGAEATRPFSAVLAAQYSKPQSQPSVETEPSDGSKVEAPDPEFDIL